MTLSLTPTQMAISQNKAEEAKPDLVIEPDSGPYLDLEYFDEHRNTNKRICIPINHIIKVETITEWKNAMVNITLCGGRTIPISMDPEKVMIKYEKIMAVLAGCRPTVKVSLL